MRRFFESRWEEFYQGKTGQSVRRGSWGVTLWHCSLPPHKPCHSHLPADAALGPDSSQRENLILLTLPLAAPKSSYPYALSPFPPLVPQIRGAVKGPSGLKAKKEKIIFPVLFPN